MADIKTKKNFPATFRILCIDTEEFVLKELAKHIAALPNVSLRQIEPNADIVAFIEKHNQDLILTPFHLPDGNGMRTARAIKNRFPQITILMLGALDIPEYQQAAKDHGVDFLFSQDDINSRKICELVESLGDKPSDADTLRAN